MSPRAQILGARASWARWSRSLWGLGTKVPSGVQGRSSGRESGGQSPPEAEEFFVCESSKFSLTMKEKSAKRKHNRMQVNNTKCNAENTRFQRRRCRGVGCEVCPLSRKNRFYISKSRLSVQCWASFVTVQLHVSHVKKQCLGLRNCCCVYSESKTLQIKPGRNCTLYSVVWVKQL